ncbi:unnamed protein product [Pieris macdunnoughi]|uniref:Cytochrome b-c1 complex subunit 8 n=1 Tax=Pieris macdunnoughi TaxID=345717 RepID=A0A821Y0G9_9NEOP|nr:unnamed protein product [Pieris macdunnoughi]
MGKHFGELAFVRGIIYYSLSPHEQKPFAGAFKDGIPNMFARFRQTGWTWLPVFLTGFGIFSCVEAAHKERQKKNPNDYINEVDPNA